MNLNEREIIRKAAMYGITLGPDDFAEDGTVDGMEPLEWLDAMTLD